MAGTIVANTLNTDTAGTVFTTNNAYNGIAKAWVNWNANAGSPIISSSFNVSSITYNAVGSFTINFAIAMSNANYSIATCGGNSPQAYGAIIGVYDQLAVPTTSALTVYVAGATGGFPLVNCTRNYVVIFGA